MLSLTDSVRLLHGVGPKTFEKLQRAGLITLADVIDRTPRSYVDARSSISISSTVDGVPAAFALRLSPPRAAFLRRGLSLIDAVGTDPQGAACTLRWFNQPYMAKALLGRTEVLAYGPIKTTGRKRYLINPRLLPGPGIIPIYPSAGGVSAGLLASLASESLNRLEYFPKDFPLEVAAKYGLLTAEATLRALHAPTDLHQLDSARRTAAFREAWAFFEEVARQPAERRPGLTVPAQADYLKRVAAGFPFKLTDGQRRIAWEALREMAAGRLMTRLINGDVGSGKTAVAAMLAAAVARAGLRTAFMAPTEILARQHAATLGRLLGPAGVTVSLHTSAVRGEAAQVAVGTHALLHGVPLPDLGLVVIDEQHRFGVKQRAQLRERAARPPHLLSLSATPIPRTLALVLYAGQDVSVLEGRPAGRPLPGTVLVSDLAGRAAMYAEAIRQVGAGRQVIVVCPLIAESEDGDAPPDERKAATAEAARLVRDVPALGQVGLLHGKMKAVEKDRVLTEFREGKISALVSTTVVEVGVDIPNATVMIVEDAERFGLSQLHQLRGRVGRGDEPGTCYLCAPPSARRRLGFLEDVSSGFDVAERDLAERGPGDLRGIAQSGLPAFRHARLGDARFLEEVREAVAANPGFRLHEPRPGRPDGD